ncbi:MAG TPA: transposase [Thermoguttaceae bacterium]|nr:transposase [Thermoguttaceae bacterium]
MIHRKTVRHFHEAGHLHELTFSCYQRMPLLTNDAWRERLARCLDLAGEEAAINLVGFVFMPEHVHLLVFPTTADPSIGRYLARIKQPFSKQIKAALTGQRSGLLSKLTVREWPGKECFRFWQEGPGFDRNLFSAEAISLSLEYIHNNPVSRGLCGRAVDWKWSSARYYLEVPPARQHSGLPTIHGLPEGATV